MGLQTFLAEGHISCYTIVRGPDILRNVIVSGYATSYQIKNISQIYFFIIDKLSSRPDEMASRTGFGPRVVVWRPWFR